jgi:hypothetical protein
MLSNNWVTLRQFMWLISHALSTTLQAKTSVEMSIDD